MKKRVFILGLCISLLVGSVTIYGESMEGKDLFDIDYTVEEVLKDKDNLRKIKNNIKLYKNMIIIMDEKEINGLVDQLGKMAETKGLIDENTIEFIKSEIQKMSKKDIRNNLNKIEKEIDFLLEKDHFDENDIKSIERIVNILNSSIDKKEELINMDFHDVNKTDWYYDYINRLVAIGSIKGYEDGTFRPKENISFAEFLKLALTSATGKDYSIIQDVHWGMTYFQEAKKLGVIEKGEFEYNSVEELDNLFNSPINREDMAVILDRISKNILNEEDEGKLDENIIEDYEDISNNKRESVKSVYKKGIIVGKDKGFDPKAYVTRGETSAVIIRLIDEDSRIK